MENFDFASRVSRMKNELRAADGEKQQLMIFNLVKESEVLSKAGSD